MKYMGSKAGIAHEILPIILGDRENDSQYFVDAFAGGMNVVDKVSGNRIANDENVYLIEMWKYLTETGECPSKISKDKYIHVRDNKDLYDLWYIGWIGFNCSYSGKFFGGYAGETKTKIGTIRDYQQEAINNVSKQIPKLVGVQFHHVSYQDLIIPQNSIIYCDPPYENTTDYKTKFNHKQFWNWVRIQSASGHQVFVSEYTAPQDFKCVWQKTVKSSLSANGKCGGSKSSVEKLFVFSG